MKTLYSLMFTLTAVALLCAPVTVSGAEQLDRVISMTGGGSTLTYSITTTMKGTGVSASATGKLTSKLTRKGTAINEQLKIQLLKLTPNTPYQLVAFIGENTTATTLNGFTTNADGTFTSTLKSSGGSANPALLNALGVLSNVREIDIVNGAGLSVLKADMVDPDKLTASFKRSLDNTGVLTAATGVLQIRATQKSIRFQLQAAGLTPNTPYRFLCNGLLLQKSTSDKHGKLKLKVTDPSGGNPDTSLDLFDIRELSLTDDTGTIVVLLTGDNFPTVISTSPVNGAIGAPLNGAITATFSKAMDPATITATTFTVYQGSTNYTGTVTYSGTTATFTLASNLPPNTVISATISTGAKDLAGSSLAANYTWTFTTLFISNGNPPHVISTAPANAATNVSINRSITASFDKAMDATTLNTSTFTLSKGITPITGTVTYSGVTAAFKPAANLATNSVFSATITTGAKDTAGNALSSNYNWSFTTGSSVDVTPPTVVSTNPVNNAGNVALNQTINATFSEAMDPTTIITANFSLTGPGASPVAGTVAYDVNSNIGSFLPSSNLAPSTAYTATVTTGVTDLAGNALVVNKVWTFTTGTQLNQTQVNFGSAGNFATLAGSTVTSVGPTVLNGDLGVSPGTAVSGFPPGMVNGAIHAGDNTAAQAKVDLLAAYNDSASRQNPIVLPGNLGGLTLTPGLYKNATSSGINGTGPQAILTLDAQGDANAVFVFQMGSTLITTVGTQVVLSGGAKAANIYWQVGSSATLGTNSIFKGNVLADQSITVTTGATLEGRVLTRVGGVTLDSNTITSPAP